MIYKVAWSPWRYGACTKLLCISILNPTSHRFCKWNWKAKHRGACQPYYDGLKVPWWGSKEAAASDKSFTPSPIPFFSGLCLATNKELFPPWPPTTSTQQRPIGLALDWHALSSLQGLEEESKLTSAKGRCWGMIDMAKDNLPLKHYWVFSRLQFCSQFISVLLICPHISAIFPFNHHCPFSDSSFSTISLPPTHLRFHTNKDKSEKAFYMCKKVHQFFMPFL